MNQFKRANYLTGSTTPIVEKSAGVRPAQVYKPAPYLPLIRFDKMIGEYKVISTGKVLAVDKNGYLVPAGLAIDIETAIAGAYANKAAFIAATAQFGHVYSATDVTEGLTNFVGDAVTAGEPVVASFFAAYAGNGVQNNTVGSPVGIAPYDAWRNNGAGQDNNPADYRSQNWNPQAGLSILTRYFIELPVVANISSVLFPGLAVYEGTVKNGDLVTFNKNSNFVTVTPVAASTFTAVVPGAPTNGELDTEFNRIITGFNNLQGKILGKVLFVDTAFPKDYLQYVRTWNPNITNMTDLDKAPGTSTAGLPDNLTYAGVSDPTQAKVARVNILI